MKNPTHPMFLGLAFIDIQEKSPLAAQGKFLEAVICREYLERGSEGVVALTHEMIRNLSGITAPTVRLLVAAMVNSGRWVVVRGSGRTPSTYQPLFLDEHLSPTGKDD